MRIGKLRASQLTSICKLFYLTQPIYVLAVSLSPDCSKRNRNVVRLTQQKIGDNCRAVIRSKLVLCKYCQSWTTVRKKSFFSQPFLSRYPSVKKHVNNIFVCVISSCRWRSDLFGICPIRIAIIWTGRQLCIEK